MARRNSTSKETQAPKSSAARRKAGVNPRKRKKATTHPVGVAAKRDKLPGYQEDLPDGFLQTTNPDQAKPLVDVAEVNAKDHPSYQEDLPDGFLQNTNPNQNQTY